MLELLILTMVLMGIFHIVLILLVNKKQNKEQTKKEDYKQKKIFKSGIALSVEELKEAIKRQNNN